MHGQERDPEQAHIESPHGAQARSSCFWLSATVLLCGLGLGILMGFTSGAVPRADEWNTPGDFLLARTTGTATFAHLFRQHNESRVIFAQLLAGFISDLWGWNQHIFHALNWALLLSTALLFLRLLRRTGLFERAPSWPVVLVLCVATALIFTPVQWRNLLYSGQIITLCIPFLLVAGLSVHLAQHLPVWLRYGCAGVFARLASFSYVNGLMLWFLLWPAPAVMLSNRTLRLRRAEIVASAVFFACAFLVIGAFFHDYHKPPGHPALTFGLLAPHRVLVFASTLLAGPIFPERTDLWFLEGKRGLFFLCGGLAGLAGLLAGAYLLRERRTMWTRDFLARVFPFAILMAYSGLSAVAIASARAGFGLSGNVSRYSTIAVPAFLGLAGLVATIELGRPARAAPRTLRAFAVVLAVAMTVAAGVGIFDCISDKQAARQAELSLAFRGVCPGDPMLTHVHPMPEHILATVAGLEKAGLLPSLPSYEWVVTSVPSSRPEMSYELHAGEVAGKRFIRGRITPSSGIDEDDILLLWDREQDRPASAFLAPAGMNYPGMGEGAFEVRLAMAAMPDIDLGKLELRLARPKSHEVWRLPSRTPGFEK